MTKKALFQRHKFDYPMHICFYCGARPIGILTFVKTHEEIQCCQDCALKYGRIKRLKKKSDKCLEKQESLILESNPCVESQEKSIIGGNNDILN